MHRTADMRGEPVTDRRDLSAIAYGFMASKALFAALEVALFTHLADGPRTLAELSTATGVAANRLQTLLHALAGLGLVVADGPKYTNAPACQRYLVRGAPGDFGEYFRLQIARQAYPALVHLDAGLAGTGAAFDTFADLLSRPNEARTFTAAQHAGSLAAARALAERVPLGDARALLDVGGGSGAFSLGAVRAEPEAPRDGHGLRCGSRRRAALPGRGRPRRRIDLLAGGAAHTRWPPDKDVVLLSYLLSALGDSEIDVVLAKAHTCLRPGGLLVVHDFMLDDHRPGPALAALWFLQYIAYRTDSVSFSATVLADRLRRHGFAATSCEVLIPEITKVILARKVGTP